MGLPKIDIVFKQKAITAIKRSADGVACLILKDEKKKDFTIKELKNVADIKNEDFSEENIQALKDCFLFSPAKIIVIRLNNDSTVEEALKIVGGLKVNWIGLVKGAKKDQATLSSWITSQEKLNKTYKAVVFNENTANSMHVVNFGNEKITFVDKRGEKTGDEYIPSLVGLFAGLPITRSATYYKCRNLTSVKEVTNIEEAVEKGTFLLFSDEGEVKVASAVNSVKEVTQDITEDMRDIIIVESMDLIRNDIQSTFKEWIGKYKNKYDNQVLFISSVNAYFKELMKEDILDSEYKNIATVDVEAQRNAWLSVGKTDAAKWDEQEVKKNSFKKQVFLQSDIKILNAVESFKFTVHMF